MGVSCNRDINYTTELSKIPRIMWHITLSPAKKGARTSTQTPDKELGKSVTVGLCFPIRGLGYSKPLVAFFEALFQRLLISWRTLTFRILKLGPVVA